MMLSRIGNSKISHFNFLVYTFLIRRRRFVRYMTTCIHNYHHADVCLTQLHMQGIIGNAVKWNGKHIIRHVHRGMFTKQLIKV